jgi:hypothetical protein
MLKYLNPSYYLRTAQRGGYTIDQTILIVVIIAILITLVIVTIGWQLINRSGGTKLASQFTQMEGAISQFYSSMRVFPHQACTTGNTPAGAVLIMAGVVPTGCTLLPSIVAGNLSNLISGFRANGTTSLRNSYGGNITMVNGTVNAWTGAAAANQYLIIRFQNVPLADAQEADRAIDGAMNPTTGRLVMSANATNCLPAAGAAATVPAATTASPVSVCYVAAPLN